MNNNGIMTLGGKEYNIRELWMEIFRSGTEAHESWKGKPDHELQALFDYWLKDKTNTP